MVLPFTLQQLRIVKTVANEKSFKMAAEKMFLSQPSLSKQIKILESRLGILLFNRTNKKVYLTEAGNLFLQYADRILLLCEETCRAIDDIKNEERGNLIIGASQTTGTYVLPRILALFVKNYPQFNITLQVNSTRVISENILNQKIDIGLVGGEVPTPFKKSLKIENFVEDELMLIISKSHPFLSKKNKIINCEDLYHLNFITLNSNSTVRKFIDNVLIQNHIETTKLNIIMELNSIEAIKTIVSLGLGVAFVSSSAIEKEVNLGIIDVINIKNITIKRKLSIITNTNSYKSKAFDSFYNELYFLRQSIIS